MPSRFLYPRTVSVTRPNAQTGVGQQGYSGLSPNAETPVMGAQSLQASIQMAGEPGNPTDLPSGVNLNDYRIYVPRGIARNLVQIRDVVTDDLSTRYRVIVPYWDSMGCNLYCRRTDTV